MDVRDYNLLNYHNHHDSNAPKQLGVSWLNLSNQRHLMKHHSGKSTFQIPRHICPIPQGHDTQRNNTHPRRRSQQRNSASASSVEQGFDGRSRRLLHVPVRGSIAPTHCSSGECCRCCCSCRGPSGWCCPIPPRGSPRFRSRTGRRFLHSRYHRGRKDRGNGCTRGRRSQCR